MSRRWNGWGDENQHYSIPNTAISYLQKRIGIGILSPDASIEQAISTIPPSRLPLHPKISMDFEDRLRHARGQSLPDWIALRSNKIDTFPDGVAYPTTEDDIQELLTFALQTGTLIIPYGGGTSVVGHINPPKSDKPILTIDMSRMNRFVKICENDHLAIFEAGVRGPLLEKYLRKRGYTLGHFPQSFEYSTVGGWIATRSSGQQSYHYGRIENLFAGGKVITPSTILELPPHPASAAGPDLRQLILGSEGRFGIITHAILRIRKAPDVEGFYGVFFPRWEYGVSAIRDIAQEGVPVSMLRLSDSMETEITLVLAGYESISLWLKRTSRVFRSMEDFCLLIVGLTGSQKLTVQGYSHVLKIVKSYKGIPLGSGIGDQWKKNRFRTPYLRNTLWDSGYAVDTIETAISWSKVSECVLAIKNSIVEAAENVLVFSHLSHVYRDGVSIYITYIFPRQRTFEENICKWKTIKDAASKTILAYGGTISHQHGIGRDHLPYIQSEKGEGGVKVIANIGKILDPDGIMNPGSLYPF